jgi:hypothetical protein
MAAMTTTDAIQSCKRAGDRSLRRRMLHCIRFAAFVFPICFLVGCWQEIEYRAPATSTTNSMAQQTRLAPTDGEGDYQTQSTIAEPASTTPDQYVGTDEANSEAPINPVEPETETSANPAESPAETPTESTDTEAVAVSVTVEAEAPQSSVNTRRAAWRLGNRLCLAALANDRGIATEDVPKWFQEAQSMAALLNVAVTELPPQPSILPPEGASPEVLKYLLEHVKSITGRLAADHGAEQASLFELATKSNLLLVYSKSDSSAVTQISRAIATIGPRTGLPPELWQPLVEALTSGAPPAAVRQAVKEMHSNVDEHLAPAVEQ